MSIFINTIDKIGDDVATNQLIERTISEFKDDIIKSIVLRAFCGCVNLESVDVPLVSSIDSYAFYDCVNLKSINFSNEVTKLNSYTFEGCSSLESIGNLDKVTMVDPYCFSRCSSLKTLSLPLATTIKNGAFSECSNLKSIEIPAFSYSNLGDNFCKNCSSLKKISGDLSSVTTLSNSAFEGCSSLREIKLPNITSIGANALTGCSSLTSVEIPKVTSLNLAFTGCSHLKSVNLPLVESCGNLTFSQCNNLTEINIPNATSINNSFLVCEALKTIDLPSVGTIAYRSFEGSSLLETLILRKTDTICTLGSSIGTAIHSGSPIVKGTGYIYVPKALIEDYKVATNWSAVANQFRAIEDYPYEVQDAGFYTINEDNSRTLTYTWQELLDNNLLTVSEDGTTLNRGSEVDALKALNGELILPKWTLKKIGQNCFAECSELSIKKVIGVTLGSHCLFNCGSTDMELIDVTYSDSGVCSHSYKLESVNIVGMRKASTNAGQMFYECKNLKTVKIRNIDVIFSKMFYNAKNLTTVILYDNDVVPLQNVEGFWTTKIESGTGYIYVPKALIEDYKVATNWSVYASQFRALEDYTIDGTIDGELDESKI